MSEEEQRRMQQAAAEQYRLQQAAHEQDLASNITKALHIRVHGHTAPGPALAQAHITRSTFERRWLQIFRVN